MKPSKRPQQGAKEERSGASEGSESAQAPAERERREKEIEEWGGGEAQRSRLNKERQLLNPESRPKP